MDRTIVYPGAIPLDTDLLRANRDSMTAIGFLAQAVLGTGVVADGLSCTQTTVPSMSVVVGPGAITGLATVDPNAYGSLDADAVNALLKMGINLTSTTLGPMSAPSMAGQSVVYLVTAAFSETDATPIVLPYYNAANPSQPYAGPNNTAAAQNTRRVQSVSLGLVQGSAATTGSQTTPAATTGTVGLYAITIANGQTSIANTNIATIPTAPFVQFKLPSLVPGFSRSQTFVTNSTFTVPAGVTQLLVTVVGGGGAGGSTGSTAGQGAACGGGAGAAVKTITGLRPGATIAVTIGAGGAPGGSGAYGGNGGTSSFGSYVSATGGIGGAPATSAIAAGGVGGSGAGGDRNYSGTAGTDGITVSGQGYTAVGGSSIFGGAGRGATTNGAHQNAQTWGAAGGGAYTTTNLVGGNGFPGIVIVEY
jgi:hypothetical protein